MSLSLVLQHQTHRPSETGRPSESKYNAVYFQARDLGTHYRVLINLEVWTKHFNKTHPKSKYISFWMRTPTKVIIRSLNKNPTIMNLIIWRGTDVVCYPAALRTILSLLLLFWLGLRSHCWWRSCCCGDRHGTGIPLYMSCPSTFFLYAVIVLSIRFFFPAS